MASCWRPSVLVIINKTIVIVDKNLSTLFHYFSDCACQRWWPCKYCSIVGILNNSLKGPKFRTCFIFQLSKYGLRKILVYSYNQYNLFEKKRYCMIYFYFNFYLVMEPKYPSTLDTLLKLQSHIYITTSTLPQLYYILTDCVTHTLSC